MHIFIITGFLSLKKKRNHDDSGPKGEHVFFCELKPNAGVWKRIVIVIEVPTQEGTQ